MPVLTLILRELRHRMINATLSLAAIVAAVALCVAFYTTGEASQNETTRIMRDLGFNLRIIPKETDTAAFWAQGYSDATLPTSYVDRFAALEKISYTHLVATLQRRVQVDGLNVLLTGIASEVSPKDKAKKPMIFEIEPGTAYVGKVVAEKLGLAEGAKITVEGIDLRVVNIMARQDTEEDIRVYVHLSDAQQALKMPGMINEIKALECLCTDPNVESIDVLRAELAEIMPEAQVLRMEAMAEARENQRLMLQGYFALITPFIVMLCAAWVGTLALVNVRDRRTEVGVLRALGYGAGHIVFLFVGKALILGILGAMMGYVAGTAFALFYGPDVFTITAKSIAPLPWLFWWGLLLAPLMSMTASAIPTALAAVQDPAQTLREE